MYFTHLDSPFGHILLTASTIGLTGLYFIETTNQSPDVSDYIEDKRFFSEVILQLSEYFNKQRTQFTVTLDMQGTDFQKRVWQVLCTIELGETKSYAWLAEQLKKPKAVRAVGGANGKNQIALIVPCHRVIGSNGTLTGYAGGLSLKEKMLKFEGAI